MAISYSTATDVADAVLEFYIRGDTLKQTIQDKPLLRALTESQETFPGGKEYISGPVQGNFMNSTDGFFAGYTGADTLAFTQAMNIDRWQYAWKETHAGLKITWTELKQDGITVTESGGTTMHSDRDKVVLTSILTNRMQDYTESWARSMNEMFWKDGTQDSKQIPGVLHLLPDDPTTGTLGNISRSNTWWRHRTRLGGSKLVASASNQTMTKAIRSEIRQLHRFGGKPNLLLAGSLFIESLELEVHEKGIYTDAGFTSAGKTDIGMAAISARGLGTFRYDPTLDDLGLSNRCYVIDTRRLKLKPMQDEENRLIKPERPHDQLVFLRSMTWTGGLCLSQPNSCAVWEV